MNKNLRVIPILFFTFVFLKTYSQTLSVSSSQLNFQNVYENAPDSIQLTITNNIGRDAAVFGIRFYDTYGSPAFSASSTSFIINNGSSVNIWVKFSPKHNILHNTEMIIENDGLRGDVSVDLIGQGKYSNHYYDITENLLEENLKMAINIATGNGYVSLGYNTARDEMFMTIDNKMVNGQGAIQNTVECIYTGREAVGYTDRTDCQTNFSFNTEHTLPQSLFSSNEPMKSDLHHLFPTDDAANTERGNNPFGIVSNPSWSNGGSKSDGTVFEPRDVHKGRAARALFYFVLRYQNYSGFLTSQEAVLRTWDKNFPPNAADAKRNNDIYAVQHNRNPFVDYPAFLDRITSISANSTAPIVSSIDLVRDTIIYGSITPNVPAIYNYVIVNNGNTNINLSNFTLTHPAELSFASTGNDTTILPGESLTLEIRCLTTVNDSIRAFLSYNSTAGGHLAVTVPIFVNDLVFSGIKEVESTLSISPNPANDYVNINLSNPAAYKWSMHDITGKIILRGDKRAENSTIDISGVKDGIYILNLTGEKFNLNRKIIVQ